VGEILDVGTKKGLFTFRRQGRSWSAGKPAFLGEPVSAVLRDKRDGALYAALSLGHFGVKLHRSDDGGATWTEIAPPAFPPAPTEVEKAPAVHTIWTLAAGGKDQPGLLWAGTLPGGLFRSDDRGQSWRLVESLWNRPEREKWMGGGADLPGINTVLVDPRDSRKITISVSCGGVWRSDDAGESWRQAGQGLRQEYVPAELAYDPTTQDVHRLARSPAAPDIVWCQHHNGIFKSTDGGETFIEIKDVKPSVFGFAVVAHPRKADVAWFVPAVKDQYRIPVDGRLVVTRTDDGGRTFQQMGDGLPAQDCYDLVYRHAFDVDRKGNALAFGSTTGNLWISGNGGKRWKLLSSTLPPIAAVAFGD
jgi:hypothetical protein